MQNKIKATLAAALIIAAILAAGWIDNDYAEQTSKPREECAWITTPDGTSICR